MADNKGLDYRSGGEETIGLAIQSLRIGVLPFNCLLWDIRWQEYSKTQEEVDMLHSNLEVIVILTVLENN